MNAAAIILAAGFSRRMGRDKALLDLGGISALERIVCSYKEAGTHRILVVTGQNHAALHALHLPVELLLNPVPEQGMFASVQRGVAAFDSAVDSFFVHPVDIPLVSQQTLRLLFQTLEQQMGCDAVIPCHDGKRGHPPLVRQSLSAAIRTYNGTDGLRGLLSRYVALQLPVSDQGVLLGMNTPQQYLRMHQYLEA